MSSLFTKLGGIKVDSLCTVLVLFALTVNCQPTAQTQTRQFDRANRAYRNGNYKKALRHYESFIRRHPEHPLTDIANQRVESLHREVESIMNREALPTPTYLEPGAKDARTADSSSSSEAASIPRLAPDAGGGSSQ